MNIDLLYEAEGCKYDDKSNSLHQGNSLSRLLYFTVSRAFKCKMTLKATTVKFR